MSLIEQQGAIIVRIPGKELTVTLRGEPERVAVKAATPDGVLVLVTEPADGTWIDSFRCTIDELADDLGKQLGVTTASPSGIRPRGFVIEHADGYGGRSVCTYTAPNLLEAIVFADNAGLSGVEFVAVWS